MLALTLRHPWAWAIAEPRIGKDIENRSWRPGLRLCQGDYFAIHGGKRPRNRDDLLAIRDQGQAIFQRHQEAWGDLDAPTLEEVTVEGIVAVARFGGVVTASASPWFEGPVGWVIQQVWRLPEPIPCTGGQGLWELPHDVHREVRRQYREALQAEREHERIYQV